ncbi:MAG: hypothetical protein ABI193_22590 [Minicystis sp.]
MTTWQSKSCKNCGATVDANLKICDRCAADIETASGAIVTFSEEAREAGESLGGLLKLLPVNAEKVAFVGRCPGGAFGVDNAGRLIWCENWGYLVSLEYKDGKLYLADRETDPNTGTDLSP